MTDNEIIKALECCISPLGGDACDECPFHKEHICREDSFAIERYALDLINRQKAEIERLKEGMNFERERVDNIPNLLLQAKAEAYSEFNARLYAYKTNIFIKGEELMIIPVSDYEEILKNLRKEDENG